MENMLKEIAIFSTKLLMIQKLFKIPDPSKISPDVATPYLEVLSVSLIELRQGPNLFLIHYVLDLVEKIIVEPAIQRWPSLNRNRLLFTKKVFIAWRKMQVFNLRFGREATADPSDIVNQQQGTGHWKQLESICSFVSTGRDEDINRQFDDMSYTIYLLHVAFG